MREFLPPLPSRAARSQNHELLIANVNLPPWLMQLTRVRLFNLTNVKRNPRYWNNKHVHTVLDRNICTNLLCAHAILGCDINEKFDPGGWQKNVLGIIANVVKKSVSQLNSYSSMLCSLRSTPSCRHNCQVPQNLRAVIHQSIDIR